MNMRIILFHLSNTLTYPAYPHPVNREFTIPDPEEYAAKHGFLCSLEPDEYVYRFSSNGEVTGFAIGFPKDSAIQSEKSLSIQEGDYFFSQIPDDRELDIKELFSRMQRHAEKKGRSVKTEAFWFVRKYVADGHNVYQLFLPIGKEE
ncbi:MAG: hypothetical protein ACLFR1_02670 [Spirochaetia bacterium]